MENIYGRPRKVIERIISEHANVGKIPETGRGKIFSTLTSHLNIVDKREMYLKSLLPNDHEAVEEAYRPGRNVLITFLVIDQFCENKIISSTKSCFSIAICLNI